MQLYRCKVRLAGSILNEVRKAEVTAAEVLILRHIHGGDAVVDISPVRSDKRPHAEERARLARLYKPKAVVAVLGLGHQPLPDSVPGVAESEEEKPRRARRAQRDQDNEGGDAAESLME